MSILRGKQRRANTTSALFLGGGQKVAQAISGGWKRGGEATSDGYKPAGGLRGGGGGGWDGMGSPDSKKGDTHVANFGSSGSGIISAPRPSTASSPHAHSVINSRWDERSTSLGSPAGCPPASQTRWSEPRRP